MQNGFVKEFFNTAIRYFCVFASIPFLAACIPQVDQSDNYILGQSIEGRTDSYLCGQTCDNRYKVYLKEVSGEYEEEEFLVLDGMGSTKPHVRMENGTVTITFKDSLRVNLRSQVVFVPKDDSELFLRVLRIEGTIS